ncbi:hypothetical protein AC1031_012937 [Aphanomyces cochlioides]|nr:hypothetical protein AC1031_012937 [Aphanomyces cochlioides]
MKGANQLKTSTDRAKWDTTREAYLLKLLMKQKDVGKQADSGFKNEAWSVVLEKFNSKFKTQFGRQQIKTRLSQLKGDWKPFLSLKNDSGFGWDTDLQKPTTPDEVWAERMEGKPKFTQAKIRSFQLNGCEHQAQLAELFDDCLAVGTYASSNIQESFSASALSAADEFRDEESNSSSLRFSSEAESVDISSPEERPKTLISTKRSGSNLQSQRKRLSPGLAIAKSIESLVGLEKWKAALPSAPSLHDATAKSIDLLNVDYHDSLNPTELATTYDIMLDPIKAQFFLLLPEGTARDEWIKRQIESAKKAM